MIKTIEKRVCNALQKNKIDFILYGSTVITDRETNDVDLIVKPKDFHHKIDSVFKEMGYGDPIPFVFEKKYQNGTRQNVEVKYDIHPKITSSSEGLWDLTYFREDGIRCFKPVVHALILYLHTDRHIKEGLFDNRRINDLNNIDVSKEEILSLSKTINDTGLAYDPVKRICNLLDGKTTPEEYSREELLYPEKKKLFIDRMTLKLLMEDISLQKVQEIITYLKHMLFPHPSICTEVGYPKQPIIIGRK